MITWKTHRMKYQEIQYGYLGSVPVFYIGWDGCTSKNEHKKWKLSWTLPMTIEKVTSEHFHSVDEAKEFALLVINDWFDRTGTILNKDEKTIDN